MKRPLAYLTAAWSGEPDIDMELAAHYCRLAYDINISWLILFTSTEPAAIPAIKNGIDMH